MATPKCIEYGSEEFFKLLTGALNVDRAPPAHLKVTMVAPHGSVFRVYVEANPQPEKSKLVLRGGKDVV